MAHDHLESLKEALWGKSRGELENFTLDGAMAHAQFCGIACYHAPDHGEEHRHATEAEMRDRIEGMSTHELVVGLAWSALLIEAVAARV